MNETEMTLRGGDGSRTSAINVGTLERVGSAIIGALLVMNGFKRRSLNGTALALTGGGLLYRGFSGHSHVYDVRILAGPMGQLHYKAGAYAGLQHE